MKKPPAFKKPVDPQLQVILDLKSMGSDADEVWEVLKRTIIRQATEQKWLVSELAATITDAKFNLREVYGADATKALFEADEENYK